MPHSSKVSVSTSSYALVLGLLLMIAPHSIFGLLFETAHATRGFVRFGGGLLALFGLYYAGAGLGAQSGRGMRGFYGATVWGRLVFVAFCIWLWATGQMGPGVLVFAAMNAFGAVSMWLAMHRDFLTAVSDGVA